MRIFNWRLIEEDVYQTHTADLLERMRLMVENEKLLRENLKLNSELMATRGMAKIIELDLGDPSPVDGVERKAYVAQVAGSYKNIWEPKLKQMISTTHSLMETPNTELDNYMRGVIYAFREIMKWGNAMCNEQIANNKGENPSSPDN